MILSNFEDITIPIENIWKNLNYRNIEAKNKYNIIIKNKKLIHNFDYDIDNLMLHALNYYDNINSFVIFGKNKNDSYKYYMNHLSEEYSLYGIKYIKVDAKMIHKIMYQLLFSRMIIKTKDDLYNCIETEYKYLHKYFEKFIDITILVVCKRDLNRKYLKYDIVDKDFCIYIPNTKESIWNCACVFFSTSTLKFLEQQNFDYFLTRYGKF